MMHLRALVAAAAALALAGCALPQRIHGDGAGPQPLPMALMQAGPQVDYRPPARDQVMGCVVVAYRIEPDGSPTQVQVVESHPAGYFDAEVLNLMQVVRFRTRAKAENGTRTFTFVPPGGTHTREAAASLCSSSFTLLPPN